MTIYIQNCTIVASDIKKPRVVTPGQVTISGDVAQFEHFVFEHPRDGTTDIIGTAVEYLSQVAAKCYCQFGPIYVSEADLGLIFDKAEMSREGRWHILWRRFRQHVSNWWHYKDPVFVTTRISAFLLVGAALLAAGETTIHRHYAVALEPDIIPFSSKLIIDFDQKRFVLDGLRMTNGSVQIIGEAHDSVIKNCYFYFSRPHYANAIMLFNLSTTNRFTSMTSLFKR